MDDLPAVTSNPFELDVEIMTAGPITAALLGSTDDGYDTVQGSDC